MKSCLKRFFLLFLSLCMLLVGCIPTTASAAETGTIYYESSHIQYGSSFTFVNPYGDGFPGGTHRWDDTTHVSRIYVNGSTGYCIQPGIRIGDGAGDEVEYSGGSDSAYYQKFPAELKQALGLVSLYGYPNAISEEAGYCATQILIWGLVIGQMDPVDFSGTNQFYTCLNKASKEEVGPSYERLLAQVKSHQVIPSFTSDSSAEAPEILMQWDPESARYVGKVEDQNGVLSSFHFSEEGLEFSQNGSVLTVSSQTPVEETVLSFEKELPVNQQGPQLVWTSAKALQQEVLTGAPDPSPVTAYFRVRTEVPGSLSLRKTAEDGKVAGIPFRITGNGIDRVVTTGEDGFIQVSDLPAGVYTVSEVNTPDEYLPQSSQEVTLSPGQTASVSFHNVLKRGAVSGKKVDENGSPLSGAWIGLFSPEETVFTEDTALQTTQSDESGAFAFTDLLYGRYLVREIAPPEGFLLCETCFPVEITEDGQTIAITIENQTMKGTVETTKVDADYPDHKLSGAAFEVYADVDHNGEFNGEIDQLVGEMAETEPGLYQMKDLVYGNYFLHEKEAPEFFEKDDGYYPFSITENGAVVRVETEAGVGFLNQAQTGSLKIVKTADDDQIEGRTFQITGTDFMGNTYEQEFQTDENGEIHVTLRVGEYTVSEVAQEDSDKYVLPDDQTVEISRGETVSVEFYNRVKTGSITLTKKDVSTGKALPDTGVEILDAQGTVIFQGRTDENGEVSFTLPYGQYFYREFDAPEGYQIDETAYPFSITEDGQVIKAEMTNEKIPEVPQTGDFFDQWFWMGLSAIALVGTIGLWAARRYRRSIDRRYRE